MGILRRSRGERDQGLLAGLPRESSLSMQSAELDQSDDDEELETEVAETIDNLRAMSIEELYEEALESVAEGDVEDDEESAQMWYTRASALGALVMMRQHAAPGTSGETDTPAVE